MHSARLPGARCCRRKILPGRSFVAENDGEIVGFASCCPERTQNPVYTGELYAIYLLQRAQRRGTGRTLVRAAAQALSQQGHTSMLVWVLDQNPSRRFYEALGGQETEQKTITIGDENLLEIAYGWCDIRALL